ncbi:MAG TPA: hypothetical protein DCE41_04570, partial [Cytophagales bacterium]|nr:hypothetical protein [Cytophagales bacterium]
PLGAQKGEEAARAAKIKGMASHLWLFARTWIFSHLKHIDPGVEERTIAHLESYYRKATTDQGLERMNVQLIKRLSLVVRWLSKDPERGYHNPEWYFNPATAKAFASTDTWYAKYQRRGEEFAKLRTDADERRLEQRLQRYVADYWVRKAEAPAKGRYSLVELVQGHLDRMRTWKDPDRWIGRYQSETLTHSQNQAA